MNMRMNGWHRKSAFAVLVALSWIPVTLAGTVQEVILDPERESVGLDTQVQVLRDTSGELQYPDIRREPYSSEFAASGITGLNFGFTRDAYWYRFALMNPPSSRQRDWVLEISWPPQDYVDIHISDGGAPVRTVHTGDQRAPGSSGIAHRNYAIALEIPPGESRTFHIRAQLEGAHQLPLTLWTADAFYAKTNKENLLYGMFYGIIAVMVVYNLLIYISIRDRAYLYYILFIFWLGVVQLSLDGFAFPLLWWLEPDFVNKSLSVFIALGTVFVPLFIRHSLQTPRHSPGLDLVLGICAYSATLCLFLPLAISVQASIFIVVLVSAATTILVATVISMMALRGHRTAQYYVLAWGVLAVGIVAKVMQTNGLLPITFVTTYALHIGLSFLVTLVSLGLADQINRERRERQRLAHEHELAETRAKLDFLGKMSHELRTPMNAIAGFTGLAIGSRSENERLTHLEHIDKASKSMLKVLDDVLNLTRIETDALKLNHDEFSLATILDQVMSLVATSAADKGIQLTVNRDPRVPDWLEGDGTHLEQVLMNLVGNAVKFTEQGFVRLNVELAGADSVKARIHFSVEDSGIGITQEQLDRLFTPFAQGDQSLSRKYGGSGLGLIISKRLVELMGGRIEVQSEPDRGSRFSFTLSLAVVAAREAGLPEVTPGEPTTDAARLRGVRVLVVDDNALNRRLAREILEDIGIAVELAENGEQAVSAVHSKPYDAVLMDLQMPVMDGLQATRNIRESGGYEGLPIIAMTANAMAQDREMALASGMNDFLPKPIDSRQLFQLLGKWIPENRREKMNESNSRPGNGVTTGLPDSLPGIELQEALQRLGGRQSLLLDLLREFSQEQQDADRRIAGLWQKGQGEDAIREAHSLKGMAANVGCNKLSETARQVEVALKQGQAQGLDALLETMAQQLGEVSESVAAIPRQAPARAESAMLSEEALAGRLAELMALVVSNDFAAQEKFDDLRPSLAAKLPADVLENLSTAIHGFDFERAAEILGDCV